MADEDLQDLVSRIKKVEEDLKNKTDKPSPLPQVVPGITWDSNEFKLGIEGNIGKYIEIFAIAKLTTLVKFGFPTPLDSGKFWDTLLEEKFNRTRNKWGWFLAKKPPDKPAEQTERIDNLITRFDGYEHDLDRRLKNTNRRMNKLEGTVSALRTNQRGTRNSVRNIPGRDMRVTGTGRVRDLESRIQQLIQALG